MTWHDAARATGSNSSGLFDGGLSWGMAILAILGFLAVVAVCGFGVLARYRDRAADRRSLEALRRSTGQESADDSDRTTRDLVTPNE
jgi:hypothetical protein